MSQQGEPDHRPVVVDQETSETIESLEDGRDGASGRGAVTARRVYQWGIAAGLGLLTVWLAYRAVALVIDVVIQVVIAVFIAISLDPAVRFLVGRRMRRGYAVALILVVVMGALVGFLVLITPPLIKQANSLVTDFPGYLDHLRRSSPGLARLEEQLHLRSRIDDFAHHGVGQLGKQALAFGQRFFGAMLSVLLIAVLTIYIMADLPRLRRGLVRLFPRRRRPQVSDVVDVVIDKVGSYMIGNLIISLIAGTAAFVAMLALRMPFALPLAIMIAIADLIPLVGATIGAAISVVVAVAAADVPTAVVLAIFFIVYQQVENYFIVPRVMRGSVDISSLAVLIVALIGGSAMGVIGALMSIPVAAAIKVILTPMIDARDQRETDRAHPHRRLLHLRRRSTRRTRHGEDEAGPAGDTRDPPAGGAGRGGDAVGAPGVPRPRPAD